MRHRAGVFSEAHGVVARFTLTLFEEPAPRSRQVDWRRLRSDLRTVRCWKVQNRAVISPDSPLRHLPIALNARQAMYCRRRQVCDRDAGPIVFLSLIHI